MFNFLAAGLMVWLLSGILKQSGQQKSQTALLPESTHMGRGQEIFAFLGIETNGTPLNPSFLLAIIYLVFFWFLINRTRLGYEIRSIGHNAEAAHYAGIKVQRKIILIMRCLELLRE